MSSGLVNEAEQSKKTVQFYITPYWRLHGHEQYSHTVIYSLEPRASPQTDTEYLTYKTGTATRAWRGNYKWHIVLSMEREV